MRRGGWPLGEELNFGGNWVLLGWLGWLGAVTAYVVSPAATSTPWPAQCFTARVVHLTYIPKEPLHGWSVVFPFLRMFTPY